MGSGPDTSLGEHDGGHLAHLDRRRFRGPARSWGHSLATSSRPTGSA